MTQPYRIHTLDSAEPAARSVLEATQAKYGFIPNLYGVLAESPTAVNAYLTLAGIFGGAQLSPVEQQVVLLTVSYDNRCDYCMAAHSVVAKMSGAPDEIIDALRQGRALDDPKLQALRQFAEAVVQKRGEVQDDLPAFLAAGYSQAQALDVLVGNALKTLSNYTNHIAKTPVDPQFAEMRWSHPEDG